MAKKSFLAKILLFFFFFFSPASVSLLLSIHPILLSACPFTHEKKVVCCYCFSSIHSQLDFEEERREDGKKLRVREMCALSFAPTMQPAKKTAVIGDWSMLVLLHVDYYNCTMYASSCIEWKKEQPSFPSPPLSWDKFAFFPSRLAMQ